jgi:signal-transduction protein with cAMP-binding, CBS, and nucleotidyltransferase domain|tara:strand:+ start:430 stop:873 length:444 start_codon:yes stop_codon:yes gene_type:complete
MLIEGILPHQDMPKTVADLNLDDEHITVGVSDTLQEGARRMLSVPGGIVVVLNDSDHVKGVLGHNQFLKAMTESVDASQATCAEWMEMDFLQVDLKDTLKYVLSEIKKRSPQAVVAVDENNEFSGYFSPSDYKQATSLVGSLSSLGL